MRPSPDQVEANRTPIWARMLAPCARIVSDPNGNILTRASHERDELVLADCPLAQIDAVRTHWPFLRDRRIDAYHGLLNRYLDDDAR